MHLAWHQPYACQVVKSRASRMGLADMVRGLGILALRLYPQLDTQAEAFHRLLSDHLLPWMLQLEAALVECQLGAAPLGLLFERHAPFTQLVYDTYLAQPARPLSTAVAALPMQLLQWPQLVAFAQDFELCPALVGWPQLARQFCFVGTCAVPHQWQRPEVHGLTRTRSLPQTRTRSLPQNPNPKPTPNPNPNPNPNPYPNPNPNPNPNQVHGLTAAQFAALLGWCALEAPTPPQQLRTPEPSSASREASASPHAAATLKLKALFAHLQLSRGAQQLRSREAANGPGSPLAA